MKKSEAIRSFEQRLGYEFSNLSLLVEALTHSSIGSDFRKDNQRLEFLGDKVLGLILSSLLFDKYNNFTEGMLSRTISHLCSGRVLYKIAHDIKLDLYFKEKF